MSVKTLNKSTTLKYDKRSSCTL